MVKDFKDVISDIQNSNADIITYELTRKTGDRLRGVGNIIQKPGFYNKYNNIGNIFQLLNLDVIIHNKFIKRNFVVDFDELVSYGEDVLFFYEVFKLKPSVEVLKGEFHEYFRNPSSITNDSIYDKLSNMYYIHNKYQSKCSWVKAHIENSIMFFENMINDKNICDNIKNNFMIEINKKQSKINIGRKLLEHTI